MDRRGGILTMLLAFGLGGCEIGEPARQGGRPITFADQGSDLTQGFDREATGRLPSDWTRAETRGAGAPAIWAVVQDRDAASTPNVLAVTEMGNDRRTFNLAVLQRGVYKDLEISVKVKTNQGKIDQGGGPVWRYQDANNYYVCRANPLEDNYRVYKVINGKRSKLASADVKLSIDRWHTLRATMIGNQITCSLDGRKLLEVEDDELIEAGHVGLWTKADAATAFDDLQVRAVEKVSNRK